MMVVVSETRFPRRMKFSIRFKLIGFTFCIVLLVGGSISLYSIYHGWKKVFATFEEEARDTATMVSRIVADDLYFLNMRSLRLRLGNAQRSPDILYTYVMDLEGTVLTDGTPENPLLDQKLIDSFSREILQVKDWISRMEGNVYKVGGPILMTDGNRIGYFQVGFSLDRAYESVWDTTRAGLLMTTLCLAVGILLAFIASTRFSRLILSIMEASKEIGEGKLDTRLSIRRGDELGTLADSINQMAINLETAKNELWRREEYFRSLIENASDIITILDEHGVISYTSPSTERILGYKPQELMGKNISEFIHKDDLPNFTHTLAIIAKSSNSTSSAEFRFRHKSNSWYILEAVGKNLRVESIISGIVINSRDITQRRHAEETIRHLAYYDPLTGLPNRILFLDRFKIALAQARRNKHLLAAMFLDLDHFKTINDTLGHTIGDNLLRAVADRLTNCLREGDTVARMGGDEFTLLLPQIDQPKDVSKTAQKILEALKSPFYFEGHELHITFSIGITVYPSDGEDVQTLLKNADLALYRAKASGRNMYQPYTETMKSKALERLVLENSLRHALEKKEFMIYYQPRIDINTRKIAGTEALLRWQPPHLGLISPSKFIPVAEETGLIIPIGEWVLRSVCVQNKAWQNAGFPPIQVAVNLSARQFQHPGLEEIITQILKETELESRYLELEITESMAMKNMEFTLAILDTLKNMGIAISLDDFGTHYSSLNYLKRFPIHTLKMDQSFVQDITNNADDAAIVNAVIVLAHSLGLKVIAEGVENEGQLNFLKNLKCDEVQGYLFSKPLPAGEFEKLLTLRS
jgi:diguanylate cyclase (GGDEF)-like protein/PAS domain S-box-containing protein